MLTLIEEKELEQIKLEKMNLEEMVSLKRKVVVLKLHQNKERRSKLKE
jgi:hypothetical protein